MSAFTQAQNDVLKRAYDMLGEQFERVLIVVDTEAADGATNASTMYFHGGELCAVGLAEYARYTLLDNRRPSIESNE